MTMRRTMEMTNKGDHGVDNQEDCKDDSQEGYGDDKKAEQGP
jgi:hypothetical protein